MGLADLRPLPIPLLVRCKLIDSCSLAGPVPAVVCRGYYRGARARFKNTKEKREKRGGKETKKDRAQSKWRRRERRRYIAPHAGTKLNLCPADRGTYLRTCGCTSCKIDERIDPLRLSCRCIQHSAISSYGISICPEIYVQVKIDAEYCNQ